MTTTETFAAKIHAAQDARIAARYAATDVTTAAQAAKGFKVIRKAYGEKYSRNGNIDKPTMLYTWTCFFRGKNIGCGESLRAAKETIAEFASMGA